MAKTTKGNKEAKTGTSIKKEVKQVADSKKKTKVEKAVEVKTEAKKPVVKQIAAAKVPEKITAKAEPKKITAAKAPEKIAAKPEPKKLTVAKETKPTAVKEETKVEVKTAKKVVKPKTNPAKKAEPKKDSGKKIVKSVDAEAKPSTKTVKVATKPVATKTIKDEPKKAIKKEPKKTSAKPTTAKKATAKKVDNNQKMDVYQAFALEECIRMMQAMQVHYSYDDYYALLMDEADLKVLEKNIIEGNRIKEQKLSYEKHGFDEDLIMITLQKVADTMDIKASEYKIMKKQMKDALKFQYSEDSETNAKQYLDEFNLSEKLLMIGQRKGIVTSDGVSELIGADVMAYFKHFFDFAYALLPEWQYSDVKFYEDFAYAVMSQFADVFESEQLRVQIDVADLYIKHGDYQHGDEMYGYILRDNNIKDYIYYRYASIYKDIDYNKAKSIAYSSLQFVDDRFMFYPNIMEIINN